MLGLVTRFVSTTGRLALPILGHSPVTEGEHCLILPLDSLLNAPMSESAAMPEGDKKAYELNAKNDLARQVTTCEGEILDAGSNDADLKRDLKSRQVNMIAIAGALGTGLIIGTGTGLARGGPGSLFIAYLTTGAAVYWVMAALGEMAAFAPMQRGFNGYAARYVDPAFG